MSNHRWTPALVLLLAFATQPNAAKAEEPRIGVAASIVPHAEVIIGENSRKLSAGSELYPSETVRTGNRGAADLVFIDSSNLRVGASSELVLDKFVLDPIRSSGVLVSQATRGTFRIATGSQDYRVNTPYGTLGLLGTHQLGEIQSLIQQGALAYAPSSAFDQAPGGTTTSGQPSVVEMVVKPPGEQRKLCRTGRPPEYGKPCPEDCEVVLRLVEGAGATYQHKSGKVANLTEPNSAACFTPSGELKLFVSTSSILSFAVAQATPPPSGATPPPSGLVTPPIIPPVVSPTAPR